jgi:predicted nucleotidyltransferase
MTLQERKRAFQQEFTTVALHTPGVSSVKFFGSFPTDRWIEGKSDIDIYVAGHVTHQNKKILREKIIDLNKKYNLELEKSCYLHPTPVFEDDKISGAAFKRLSEGKEFISHGVMEMGAPYSKILKKLCIPHELIWKILMDE